MADYYEREIEDLNKENERLRNIIDEMENIEDLKAYIDFLEKENSEYERQIDFLKNR
ncbi:MAG: hypothetical protein N4A40_09945 [Tissierellales bacterium]|jgi:prefoldin subunit 5|nr:hypothetical protein [Tissierellales bacterium]